MAAAEGGPELPGRAVEWWGVIAAAATAALGGVIGLVSKVNSQGTRIESIEKRQDRNEAAFSEWLNRVEGKIDTINDHFAEKGIHDR